MNNGTLTNLRAPSTLEKDPCAIAQFREKFKRSLRQCVVRGFSVEEAFGMIWVETLEEVLLTDEEQGELYEDLISWAKSSLLGFFPSNSQELFTISNRCFSDFH